MRATAKPPEKEFSDRIVCFALFVAAAALFMNSLRGEFLLDDIFLIADNPLVRDVRSVFTFFTKPYWHGTVAANSLVYRPLMNASYVLTYAWAGNNPIPYHLTNVLMHAGNVVLAYVFFRRLTGQQRMAGLAALLFLVHPIHTEAVDCISNRTELAATFFVLASLLLYQAERLWLCVGAFALGLLCKENAIVIPVLLFLLDRARGRKMQPRALAALAACGLAYFVIRGLVLGSLVASAQQIPLLDNPIASVDPLVRILTALTVLGRYLFLLVFPLHLSPDYSYPQIPALRDIVDGWLLLSLAGSAYLLSLLTPGFWPKSWKKPARGQSALSNPAAFGVAFFFLSLLPVANILIPISNIMAERLLYLPSVGLCLTAGFLIARGWESSLRKPLWAGAVAVVLVLFAARTWVRNADWRDERTLFARAAEVAPRSARVRLNYGNGLSRSGELDAAVEQYRRAIELYPEYVIAHSNLCVGLANKGDYVNAKASCQKALMLNPEFKGAQDAMRFLEGKGV